MTVTVLIIGGTLGVILLLLLRRNSSAYAALAECGLAVIIIMAVLPEVREVYSTCKELTESLNLDLSAIKMMLKAFGILALGGICTDICRDNGESAIGTAVDTAVKVMATACVLPIFAAVLKTALAFIN